MQEGAHAKTVPLYPSSTLSTIGWAVAAYTCPERTSSAVRSATRCQEARCTSASFPPCVQAYNGICYTKQGRARRACLYTDAGTAACLLLRAARPEHGVVCEHPRRLRCAAALQQYLRAGRLHQHAAARALCPAAGAAAHHHTQALTRFAQLDTCGHGSQQATADGMEAADNRGLGLAHAPATCCCPECNAAQGGMLRMLRNIRAVLFFPLCAPALPAAQDV